MQKKIFQFEESIKNLISEKNFQFEKNELKKQYLLYRKKFTIQKILFSRKKEVKNSMLEKRIN